MSMFSNLIIGQYVFRNSVIHRLDPRTKLVAVFVFMISFLLLQTFMAYIIAYIMIFILIMLANLPLKYIVRGLKPLWIIVFITFFFHLLWSEGETILLQLGFTTIYFEGLLRALMVSLKVIGLVTIASLLTLTTKSSNLTDGLESLLAPLRMIGLPTQQFALMISITLRFIPILIQETERIMKAQVSRGVNFSNGNIVKRFYQFIPVIIPLLILAFQKAESISLAIEARGYYPGMVRTQLHKLIFNKNDYMALTVTFILLVIVIGLRI